MQLWHIILPEAPLAEANAAVNSALPAELVSFAHGSLFSQALSTLATALGKGYLANFPGLSSRSLQSHHLLSAATTKGHLDQSRKSQRSTKSNAILLDSETEADENDDESLKIMMNLRPHPHPALDLISVMPRSSNQLAKFVLIKQANLSLPLALVSITHSSSATTIATLF